jgi:hypothetical protein
LLSLIARRPDFMLDEIVVAMPTRGIAPTASQCGASLSAEAKQADVAQARRRWMREQGMFTPMMAHLAVVARIKRMSV